MEAINFDHLDSRVRQIEADKAVKRDKLGELLGEMEQLALKGQAVRGGAGTPLAALQGG